MGEGMGTLVVLHYERNDKLHSCEIWIEMDVLIPIQFSPSQVWCSISLMGRRLPSRKWQFRRTISEILEDATHHISA